VASTWESGTPKASRAEYDRLMGERLAGSRCLPHGHEGVRVAELALPVLGELVARAEKAAVGPHF